MDRRRKKKKKKAHTPSCQKMKGHLWLQIRLWSVAYPEISVTPTHREADLFKKVTLHFSLCVCMCVSAALCNGALKIPSGLLLPLVTDVGAHDVCVLGFFVRMCVFCSSAGCFSTVTYCKPWAGWLLSGLGRLITLSAQWWSCLDLFMALPRSHLFLISQVITQRVLDWQAICAPHPFSSLLSQNRSSNTRRKNQPLFYTRLSSIRNCYQSPDIYRRCFRSLKLLRFCQPFDLRFFMCSDFSSMEKKKNSPWTLAASPVGTQNKLIN